MKETTKLSKPTGRRRRRVDASGEAVLETVGAEMSMTRRWFVGEAKNRSSEGPTRESRRGADVRSLARSKHKGKGAG